VEVKQGQIKKKPISSGLGILDLNQFLKMHAKRMIFLKRNETVTIANHPERRK
jgi:hypothetical protein